MENNNDKKEKSFVGEKVSGIGRRISNKVDGGVSKAKGLGRKIAFTAIKTLMRIKRLLLNPVTLLILLVLFVLVPLFATLNAFSATKGKNTFGIDCKVNAVGSVNLEDYSMEDVTIHYLSYAVDDEEAAGFLTAVIRNVSNFDPNYSNTSLPANCGGECLLELSEDPTVEVGIIGFSGESLEEFANYIIDKRTNWNQYGVQVSYISDKIKRSYNEGRIRLNNYKEDALSLFNKNYESYSWLVADGREIAENREQILSDCVPLGHGGMLADLYSVAGLDPSNSQSVALFISTEIGQDIKTPGSPGDVAAEGTNYKAVKDEAARKGTSSEGAPYLYSSCDRTVATIMITSDIDIDFPWGAVTEQHNHVSSSPMWKQVSYYDRQPGDIIFVKYHNGYGLDDRWGHIVYYYGDYEGQEIVVEGSYYDYLPARHIFYESRFNNDMTSNLIEFWRPIGGR